MISKKLILGAYAGVAGWNGVNAAQAPSQDRPNIIFILTDDQRYDAMNILGTEFLDTPHQDRIAREGVIFNNAFATASVCGPSRASFLTGVYPHVHGVRNNSGIDPDPALPTFPGLLQGAGYETAFIGKWHMGYGTHPRPGFDYWLSFEGQGVYRDPVLNENGRQFKAPGYMTDLLNQYALDWLKERKPGEPYCLYLSHKAMHYPFDPPERHKNKYKEDGYPEHPGHRDTLEGKPVWQRRNILWGWNPETWTRKQFETPPEKLVMGSMPSGALRPYDPSYKHNYYELLDSVDEGVGEILRFLKERGELDQTVIIYTSDNGHFNREHFLEDKRTAHEESMRIPMIMRYPKRIQPGSQVDQMVLNIDMAPTVCELAGVPAPEVMQGRSVLPLLTEENPEWRSAFPYIYCVDIWPPSFPSMQAVRTEDWKYVSYPNIEDIGELYDLKNDPHELSNLYLNPEFETKLKEMKGRLSQLLRETRYTGRISAFEDLVPLFHGSFDQKENTDEISGTTGMVEGDLSREPGIRGSALRFDGNSVLRFPEARGIAIKKSPYSVEAWVNPEKENGIVLSCGGGEEGFALWIEDGLPVAGVKARTPFGHVVRAEKPLEAGWSHLAFSVTRDYKLKLYVNGSLVGQTELPNYHGKDPGPVELGGDSGEKVGYTDPALKFTGRIDEVKIYKGELRLTDILENL
jgi:arylsulfatase A-like enzyme